MTNVRLSADEQQLIVRAIETQMEGTVGLIANPAAFLRDAGLKEARRIISEMEKGRR
jgi:hypothetical protein